MNWKLCADGEEGKGMRRGRVIQIAPLEFTQLGWIIRTACENSMAPNRYESERSISEFWIPIHTGISVKLTSHVVLHFQFFVWTIQNPLAIRDPRIPMNFFSPPLANTIPATLLRIQLAPFYLFFLPPVSVQQPVSSRCACRMQVL